MASAYTPNIAVAAGTQGSTAMWNLKNALIASGWTVRQCGDGQPAGLYSAPDANPAVSVVDVLDTAAKMVLNAGAGQGPWIVLRSPRAPNREMLIGHRGAVTDANWHISVAEAGGYLSVEGTSQIYPVAGASVSYLGAAPGTLAALFPGTTGKCHVYADGASDNFYCLCSTAGGYVLNQQFSLEMMTGGPVDPYPYAINISAAAPLTNLLPTGNFLSMVGAATPQAMGVLNYWSRNGLAVIPWSSASGCIAPGYSVIDSKFDEIPMPFARDQNYYANTYNCFKGFSTMQYYVGQNVASGSTLTRNAVVMSRVVFSLAASGPIVSFPWDGATIPLT